MRLLAVMLAASAATPALAQDHSGHAAPSSQPVPPTECEREAARHRAMGHAVPEGACAPEMPANAHQAHDHSEPKVQEPDPGKEGDTDHSAMSHSAMDHSAMDRGEKPQDTPMDHGSMNHDSMNHDAMNHGQSRPSGHAGVEHGTAGHGGMDMDPIPAGPPPPSAGSGPPRAADAIWGAEAMQASREALRAENGGMKVLWLQGDRLEYRGRKGGDGYLWDIQGYYGGDLDKFWFKSEGEGEFGEELESAEIQGLWSHAIGPWWDLQTGLRQDLNDPQRTYGVVGVQGLAPYMFEVDAAAFLSTKGEFTARVEAELDQRVTQRLILQPRGEINLSAQDVPELGIGAGIDSVELGLRLRYELAREFAPYIGIEQEWKVGGSADYARSSGEDASVTNYVVGLRFWF